MSYPYPPYPPQQGYPTAYPPSHPPPHQLPQHHHHQQPPHQPNYSTSRAPPPHGYPPQVQQQQQPIQHHDHHGSPAPAPPHNPASYPPRNPAYAHPHQPYTQQPPPQAPSGSNTYRSPMPPAVSTAPSLGYDPDQRAPGDATHEADALHEALKAYPATDATTLIRILAGPDPLEMALIRDTYAARHGRSLTKDILSQTTGSLAATLGALADGPLEQDITHLHDGILLINNNNNNNNNNDSTSADTSALTDVLIGRSNADLRAIKYAYVNKYGATLVDTIRSNGGPAGPFFAQLLSASRPENASFFDQGAVEDDVRTLHAALLAADEVSVGELFLAASDARLAAVAAAFEARYQVELEGAVWESGFEASVREVLGAMVAHAVDPVLRVADRLVRVGGAGGGSGGGESIGAGVVDAKALGYWVVRLHWNRPYLEEVKTCLVRRLGADFGMQIRKWYPVGDGQVVLLAVWG